MALVCPQDASAPTLPDDSVEPSDWLTNATCGALFRTPVCSSSTAEIFKGCLSTFNIHYLDTPPYIFYKGSKQAMGYWPEMITDFMKRSCCNGNLQVNFLRSAAASQTDLMTSCAKSPATCHMSVGGVASPGTQELEGVPYASLTPTNGVAFVTVRGELWRLTMAAVADSLVTMWPLIFVSMVLALVAGILIWFFETWKNKEQFPRNFLIGSVHGMWWSIVSMTTVGYGDKHPLSLMGRIFSVVWILLGLSLISVITSILSNALTEALQQPEILMSGKKVGYLSYDIVAYNMINRESGVPIESPSVDALLRNLATGHVTGFAMDKETLLFIYKSRLKEVEVTWNIQNVFKSDEVYGMSFYMARERKICTEDYEIPGTAWKGCYDEFREANENNLDRMKFFYMKASKIAKDSGILVAPPITVSLIDPASEEFGWLVLFAGALVAIILIAGLGSNLVQTVMRKLMLRKNPGYKAEESAPAPTTKKQQSADELMIAACVDKTLNMTDERITEFQKQMRNEILNMSRTIRRQLKSSDHYDSL